MPKRRYTQEELQQYAHEIWDLFDIEEQPRWIPYSQIRQSELRQRERTIRALVSDFNDLVSCERGVRIRDCSQSVSCNELFCPRCRSHIQHREEQKVLSYFNAAPHHNLRALTILLPVSYHPISELPKAKRKAKDDLQNALRRFPSLRFYGAFEIDVKTPKLVQKHRTAHVLDELGMNRFSNDPAYLLHLHAIVDLSDAKHRSVSTAIRNKFHLPYQVRLSNLYSTKTKQDNLSTLARYMTKYRLQYANNIYGNAAYGKATYGEFYEDEVIRVITKAYNAILSNTTSISSYQNVGQVSSVKKGI